MESQEPEKMLLLVKYISIQNKNGPFVAINAALMEPEKALNFLIN